MNLACRCCQLMHPDTITTYFTIIAPGKESSSPHRIKQNKQKTKKPQEFHTKSTSISGIIHFTERNMCSKHMIYQV